MLEVENIHTYYGKSYVLQGVSLRVEKGTTVAVMGRNGMGKTTLIRSIMGLAPAASGRIIFKKINITNLPTYKIVRIGIGLVPQGRFIFSSLNVEENLQVATIMKSGGWNIEKVLSLFPSLKGRLSHMGDQLSGGEQQMIACGRALVCNPELLLLDEPSEGLAPLLTREVTKMLIKLKASGLAILLVEPSLNVVKKVADYVYIMSKGTIVYESIPEELLRNTEVKSQYLAM
jgi:branched-chain amino acid transport system ATP-binding protein